MMKLKLISALILLNSCGFETEHEPLACNQAKGKVIVSGGNTVIQLLTGNEKYETSSWVNPASGKEYNSIIWMKNDCGLDLDTWGVEDVIYFTLNEQGDWPCLWNELSGTEPDHGYYLENISDKPCQNLMTP